ncbi:flagellar filament capping protein FliD [Thermaerobacter subterraneus]|uniref:Flagellar hook-associated protein 2 n=1 Tax=Thermaerobacter subterraneus DSM 13965 TaxID=867903 RepID=K6Q136_9FIRM|nr:flagellar filament capping protein FliD [Thermaerobacter subterraneus]EKP94644.1 flagellar capping protein [Thermaerobacter subterraneus DSM 13965]
MRIGGLASGLDWEQLVEQLMQIERRPLLLLERRKLEIESEKNAWSDIRSRIDTLQDRIADVLAQDLFWRPRSTSSDEARVTAEASAAATPGTYTVEVQQLATAHSIATYDPVADPQAALNLSGTFRITVGSTSFDVTVDTTDSLNAIRDRINAAVEQAVQADPAAEASAVRTEVIGGHLVITRTHTGQGAIDISDVSGTVAQSLGLIDAAGAERRVLVTGQDAQFTVNGLAFTRSSNTVSDVVQGVTLELHQAAPGNPVTVTVAWDDDAVVGAVKKFIEQYNSALSFMAQQQDYQGAGGGKLGGDVLLTTLRNELRRMVSDPVAALAGSTTLDRLAAVGITTQDKSGTLQLDEAKLREALAADRAGVQRLLAGDPDASATSDDGVFVRLQKALDGWLKTNTGLFDRRIDSLDDRARDYAEQMERMEYRLKLREQNLTRQFEALETLLSTLQSQEQWLVQQVNQLASLRPKD